MKRLLYILFFIIFTYVPVTVAYLNGVWQQAGYIGSLALAILITNAILNSYASIYALSKIDRN